MKNIGIIGGGAWGTALAQVYAKNGNNVLLWAREEDVVSSVNEQQENRTFLPGVKLEKNLKATGSLTEAAEADILLIVTPAQHMRSTLAGLKAGIDENKPVIICAKGVEIETGMLLSHVARETSPQSPIGILTGPTFAAEIARGLPSAVTLAFDNQDRAEQLAEELSTRSFRLYASDDVVGAQIGGAVKNVIAIACGIVEGKKLGESARAALVTRGLAEMARLASALGAKRETLMGMCGVGDLILTCSSMQSRNFSLGFALGQGKTLQEILASRNSVTEGVHTAKALMLMARNNAVDMPVSEAVHLCLSEGARVDDVIARMMDRPLRAEGA
jgi:glycerol-3-phosphate dehydrogenase (NAD(P)+)